MAEKKQEVELHPQLVAHGQVDRIQAVGAIECQPDDVVRALRNDEGFARCQVLVGHGPFRLSPDCDPGYR